MSLSNIASRGVWGVGRRALSEVGRSPTDKTTTHAAPALFSLLFFSISLSLVSHPGHTITLVPHRHHTITLSSYPTSGSRSLTTRTRSCGRVVKDAKRSAGEGPVLPQTAWQSHKPRWGTCRTTRPRGDTPRDGQSDTPATPLRGLRPEPLGASFVTARVLGRRECSPCAARPRHASATKAKGPIAPGLHGVPGGCAGATQDRTVLQNGGPDNSGNRVLVCSRSRSPDAPLIGSI